ncbi:MULTISPECIES: hypothetical protein [Streptomyces]|uniref:hypothetical protein n=1 Tax=Streptomyces TaxID=1883 RepID=UPI0029C39A7F|nr:hypothetical protein [Streptomyces sp. ID01-9D]MDX5575735.1 hypothetical protein [Streptomyces sp. ID01-9D]WSV25785.1 hypothetical protein OG554_37775 [Streptomyces fimicarius]
MKQPDEPPIPLAGGPGPRPNHLNHPNHRNHLNHRNYSNERARSGVVTVAA